MYISQRITTDYCDRNMTAYIGYLSPLSILGTIAYLFLRKTEHANSPYLRLASGPEFFY